MSGLDAASASNDCTTAGTRATGLGLTGDGRASFWRLRSGGETDRMSSVAGGGAAAGLSTKATGDARFGGSTGASSSSKENPALNDVLIAPVATQSLVDARADVRNSHDNRSLVSRNHRTPIPPCFLPRLRASIFASS